MLAVLLAELAQGVIPALPGARCRGREELFDATISQADWDNDGTAVGFARRAAMRVCGSCPALAECEAWIESLPRPLRPRGVVAGQFTDAAGRRWYSGRKLRRDSKAAQFPDTPESVSA